MADTVFPTGDSHLSASTATTLFADDGTRGGYVTVADVLALFLVPSRVISSSANVTLLSTDNLVCFARGSSPSATTVTLPATPASGQQITVKDMGGNAATYPITIQPSNGTIDGGANIILNQNREAVSVIYNGAEWSVV